MLAKLRILHIVSNLHHGGMERIIAELARKTDPDRFDSHILALEYLGELGESLSRAVNMHVAEPMPMWSMLHPEALTHQIAKIRPDIVHLHSGVLYKASLAAKRAGISCLVYTDHGRQNPDPWVSRFLDRRASKRLDAIVAVSDQLRTQLAAFVYAPSRVHVIYNGVDTHRYSPGPERGSLRRELGLDADVPIIGSTGRLEPVKGYDVLLEAFAQLRAQSTLIPGPELVLVGDGTERSALERRALALGVADAVHFVGWRTDIEQLSRAFTVFTMSSHSEGTSVSLLEAMSLGICPVVTDVGGNAAALGPTLKHRLVPPSQPDALARGLSNSILDVEQRARDGSAARARIVETFGLDAMVDRYQALYGQLLQA